MIWLFSGTALLTLALFLKFKWLNIVVAVGFFAVYFDVLNQPIFDYIIFLIGVAFLIIELYIPDFGIVGILGVITIIYSLAEQVREIPDLILLLLALVGLVLAVSFISYQAGLTLQISPQFILNRAIGKQVDEDTLVSYGKLINETGRVIEDLRPVGKIKLDTDQQVYEVMSEEGMLEMSQPVYISRVKGTQLYVRKINE